MTGPNRVIPIEGDACLGQCQCLFVGRHADEPQLWITSVARELRHPGTVDTLPCACVPTGRTRHVAAHHTVRFHRYRLGGRYFRGHDVPSCRRGALDSRCAGRLIHGHVHRLACVTAAGALGTACGWWTLLLPFPIQTFRVQHVDVGASTCLYGAGRRPGHPVVRRLRDRSSLRGPSPHHHCSRCPSKI